MSHMRLKLTLLMALSIWQCEETSSTSAMIVLRQKQAPIANCNKWFPIPSFMTCKHAANICHMNMQQLILANQVSGSVPLEVTLSDDKCKCGNTFLPDDDIAKYICCEKITPV